MRDEVGWGRMRKDEGWDIRTYLFILLTGIQNRYWITVSSPSYNYSTQARILAVREIFIYRPIICYYSGQFLVIVLIWITLLYSCYINDKKLRSFSLTSTTFYHSRFSRMLDWPIRAWQCQLLLFFINCILGNLKQIPNLTQKNI